jgi:parallel beta-helix repeat protein
MKRIACLLFVCANAVLAQNDARTLSNPGTISAPGSYRLDRDIFGTITILANDVTLNLNGYSLSLFGARAENGITIRGVQGVEVFGGSIHDFGFGVVVENSANVRLHDLRIRALNLPVVSPPPEVGIMIAQSSNVVVENNSIHNAGLGIFVRGGMSRGNRIANNTVTGGSNSVFGICYNPAPADSRGPRGDLITNNVITGFPTAISMSDLSLANVMRGNTLAYGTIAIQSPSTTNMDVDNIKVKLP